MIIYIISSLEVSNIMLTIEDVVVDNAKAAGYTVNEWDTEDKSSALVNINFEEFKYDA